MQKFFLASVSRAYHESPLFFFAGGLAVALTLTAYLYWPGLSGHFIFDDFPSLQLLDLIPAQSTRIGGIVAYLDGSYTGPTKRPLSMLSFLIEYAHWPDSAAQFKRDNILFHIVVAMAVAWLTLLVAKRAGKAERTALAIAIITATVFALHPFLVSTVLYVVQRMAILAALFCVLALIAFLKGVNLVENRRRIGWLLLLVIYPLLGLMALLSKENGVLVVLLAGVLVYFLPIRSAERAAGEIRCLKVVAFAPALALLVGLAAFFVYLMATNPNLVGRRFTIIERLMTQPRVLLDYLAHIFIPRMQSGGVYNDGIVVSRSLIEPWSTIPAMVIVSACIAGAFFFGRRQALLGIAVAGFFAAHAVESTFIGLELYYEHRNYLPCIFLFMGFSALLVELIERRPGPGLVCAGLIIVMLSMFTRLSVQLWANTPLMFMVWADQYPESERAQMQVASFWASAGEYDRGLQYVERAKVANSESPNPPLYSLAIRCTAGRAVSVEEIEQIRRMLRQYPYHPSTYNYLAEVLSAKRRTGCSIPYEALSALVDALFSAPASNAPDIQGLKYFELGNLLLQQHRAQEALAAYTKASAVRNDVQAGLVEIAMLASAGLPDLALVHADTVEGANARRCKNVGGSAFRLRCEWVDSEVERLRVTIRKGAVFIPSGENSVHP